jgi:hypothetical protein
MQFRLAVILSLLTCSCCPANPVELSPKEIAAAKKLYTAKCARCHKFYDPKLYPEAEWTSWMAKMRKKARLKKDQYDLLLRYTESLRRGSSDKDTSRPVVGTK